MAGPKVSSMNTLQAGLSPLMLATNKGNLETVRLLLKAGAQVDLRNKVSWTFRVSYRIFQKRGGGGGGEPSDALPGNSAYYQCFDS